MRNGLVSLIAAIVVLAVPMTAQAGGYDTPMLYSARHMGMGGTAVSYVDDASALFHNPAGLARNESRVSLLGDFSLLLGTIQGSPSSVAPQSVESDTTTAPFFLVGGSFRITDWFVAGIAVYPVASAGAKYNYVNNFGGQTEDSTSLVFIEASPGVAFNIRPARVTLGASWRMTYVSLTRQTIIDGTTQSNDFSLTGLNFAGFRVGAQWEAIEDHLSVGVHYRHETVTEVTNDDGIALSQMFQDVSTEFTLPSRLSFGVRGDYNGFAASVDAEIGFNSQNKRSILIGTPPAGGAPVMAANVFQWSDALTLRTGLEYNIPMGAVSGSTPEADGGEVEVEQRTLSPRLGYIFDARTSNPAYPTAFGTPPGPTHVLTGGVGYDHGPWEVNGAFAHRFGSATVTDADIAAGDETCLFCGQPGDYEIALSGIYVDFSYDFE